MATSMGGSVSLYFFTSGIVTQEWKDMCPHCGGCVFHPGVPSSLPITTMHFLPPMTVMVST